MLASLSTLAQVATNYSYDYSYGTTTAHNPAVTGIAIGVILFVLAFVFIAYIFFAICLLKIFKKAGRKDAWAAFVPIYNFWVYYEIAGRPGWWALLTLIPIAGGVISLVTMIIASIDLAKAFGKEAGYGILLALVPVIGYPMLAFGDATYHGVEASSSFGAPLASQSSTVMQAPAPDQEAEAPVADTPQPSDEEVVDQSADSLDSSDSSKDQ